jgi:hypothetical protein
MRRSSSSPGARPLGVALFLSTVPPALLALPQSAWAASVPAPSPGPPFTAPAETPSALLGFVLFWALAGAVAVALAGLAIAVGDRPAAWLPATRSDSRQAPAEAAEDGSAGTVTEFAARLGQVGQGGPEQGEKKHLKRAS